MKFKCRCGAEFTKRMHLIEHIGICNPKWPQVSPNDEHANATKGSYANDYLEEPFKRA